MTAQPPPQMPQTPDGSELTPEEWDAVRRLRGERSAERAAPESAPAAPATTPSPATPAAATPAAATPTPAAPAPAEPATTPDPEQWATEPAASVEPQSPRWGGRGRNERPFAPGAAASALLVPAMAALVVLAVAAAALAVIVGLRVSDNHARDRAGTAALAAATTGVGTVLSYNYRSLDADFAKAESLLTPEFRKTYQATTAKAVQPLAAKYQAVSSAQVSAAGMISASTSRATVLVFVSQQVTNSQLSAPRLDRSRIQVDLVNSHGHWLIARLTPL